MSLRLLNVYGPGLIERAENKLVEAFTVRNRIVEKMGFADFIPPMIRGFENPVLSAVQLEPHRPNPLSRLIDDGNSDGNTVGNHF
jgi:hypothetical protein